MITRPARSLAVALCACLVFPHALLAQDHDYSRKDYKRAKSVVENDADYTEIDTWTWLSEAERALLKEQIVQTIAAKLDGKKPSKFKKIDVVSQDGRTVKDIAGRTYSSEPRYINSGGKRYEVVELEQDIENVPPKEIWESAPLQLDNFGNLFADNQWEPGGKNKASVDTAIQALKAVLTDGTGDRKLTKIMIKSSASTLKNTNEAAALTHYELSLKRAEAARDYLLAQLGPELTKDIPIEINADGINYDEDIPTTLPMRGTSGPSSPYPCPSGTDPKFCPPGDDAFIDKLCFEDQQTKGGGDNLVELDEDSDPWDWNDDIEVECDKWERIKEIKKVSYSMWSKQDKALIRSFYAPFKYVGVRLEGIKKTSYTKGTKGKAHMVLAIVESEPENTTTTTGRLKYKTHFEHKETRPKSKATRKTTRNVKKECKNAHKKKRLNKKTGTYKH